MRNFLGALLICLTILSSAENAKTQVMPPSGFTSAKAFVNGVEIHYVMGGHGDLLVLLHGFGENWYTWNRLFPALSKHFTILAPDLRGIGESGEPAGGYDKSNMAEDIHALVKKFGYSNIMLAGHDIGLMVAYAYASKYSDEVKKLVLMDAAIPGIEPVWSQKKAVAWWFGFFSWSAAPGLIKGRDSVFLNNFWLMSSHTPGSFTGEEKKEFVRAYATREAMAKSFQWFIDFRKDAEDNLMFAEHLLPMPVLAMGGEYAASHIADQIRMVALHVKSSVIQNAGHWLVEENTAQVQNDLLDFFLNDSTPSYASYRIPLYYRFAVSE